MGFVLFVSVIAFYVECWLFLLLSADVYDQYFFKAQQELDVKESASYIYVYQIGTYILHATMQQLSYQSFIHSVIHSFIQLLVNSND